MAQLPSQSQFGDYGEWPGRDVLDSGGERLGGVREIYLDRETGRPEWVLVDVDGDEARFVPLADAAVESSTIRVAHSADAIRNAPGIGAEPRIDQSEERRLYDHYGLGYAESGSGLPAEEPTREHEQPAAGPTPTAWGAPDAPVERGARVPDRARRRRPSRPPRPRPPRDPPWRVAERSRAGRDVRRWSAAADDEAVEPRAAAGGAAVPGGARGGGHPGAAGRTAAAPRPREPASRDTVAALAATTPAPIRRRRRPTPARRGATARPPDAPPPTPPDGRRAEPPASLRRQPPGGPEDRDRGTSRAVAAVLFFIVRKLR